MQKKVTIRLLPSEAANDDVVHQSLAQACAVKAEQVTGYNLLKQSIDARGWQIRFHITANVFIDEPYQPVRLIPLLLNDVHNALKKVVVVGAGPAGLFAALRLIELGIKPIIIEQGKDVRARRRDLAVLNKQGVINPESNYCFGEGGAGTYSDGKLYTRSTKRGDVQRILSILVHFGADQKILYEAHPHIGTNKLPHIITAMREKIVACGGEVLFETKLTDFSIVDNTIKSITTHQSNNLQADAVILATGHSARDVFEILLRKKWQLHFKPFALGVRVEHPQALIDAAQYHCEVRGEHLPPAAYSLVQQVHGKGVFSFCMCPGGIIAPAATNPNEVVVNGWSPSKRNNPFANSGIVVSVEERDLQKMKSLSEQQKHSPLKGVYFQQLVEQKAYTAGGGNLVAPAQRLVDFVNNQLSSSLPDCSYLPGIHSAELRQVLPSFIHQSLQKAFKEFGKRMKGYFTNEAVIVATESRTSSPVRIPRHAETLQHPQITNLYPCGEGAGYAGGIVSAAMDGERVAQLIAAK
ncbi:MAG: FAD-binding protein [Flavisolibacter sp.]|nr:FAD-binding protein [Flavisolibacter sp.]